MFYILYYTPSYGLVTLYIDLKNYYKRTKEVLGNPDIRNNLPFPWFSHAIICMMFDWADLRAGWG